MSGVGDHPRQRGDVAGTDVGRCGEVVDQSSGRRFKPLILKVHLPAGRSPSGREGHRLGLAKLQVVGPEPRKLLAIRLHFEPSCYAPADTCRCEEILSLKMISCSSRPSGRPTDAVDCGMVCSGTVFLSAGSAIRFEPMEVECKGKPGAGELAIRLVCVRQSGV